MVTSIKIDVRTVVPFVMWRVIRRINMTIAERRGAKNPASKAGKGGCGE